jgi:hypothetical protein
MQVNAGCRSLRLRDRDVERTQAGPKLSRTYSGIHFVATMQTRTTVRLPGPYHLSYQVWDASRSVV